MSQSINTARTQEVRMSYVNTNGLIVPFGEMVVSNNYLLLLYSFSFRERFLLKKGFLYSSLRLYAKLLLVKLFFLRKGLRETKMIKPIPMMCYSVEELKRINNKIFKKW